MNIGVTKYVYASAVLLALWIQLLRTEEEAVGVPARVEWGFGSPSISSASGVGATHEAPTHQPGPGEVSSAVSSGCVGERWCSSPYCYCAPPWVM
ncbi:unnamed protein product [Gadus morhua 'NCC']